MFRFLGIFGVILVLYGLLNWWIGRRGWQYLGRFVPGLPQWAYGVVYGLLALSYLAGRMGESLLPAQVYRGLTLVGSYWLGFFYYMVLVLALLELGRWLGRRAGWVSPGGWESPRAWVRGGGVLVLVLGIVGYGAWNAQHPRVTTYEVRIPKEAGERKELRVVAVSDLHLGTIVHNGRLTRLVEEVNRLQPDLVLLPGDVIDEDPGPFAEQDMASVFRRMNPPLGVYAAPGNHEYIGGQWERNFAALREAGVRLLRDEAVLVDDSFYVAGRDDSSGERFSGGARKSLADVLAGVDRSRPVLLMDHQPNRLEESRAQGVDLQLSGHTHRGQLYPNHLITGQIFETDWGYLKKGDLNVIVSSGFGTWGPPLRVGAPSEIVEIKVVFGRE